MDTDNSYNNHEQAESTACFHVSHLSRQKQTSVTFTANQLLQQQRWQLAFYTETNYVHVLCIK